MVLTLESSPCILSQCVLHQRPKCKVRTRYQGPASSAASGLSTPNKIRSCQGGSKGWGWGDLTSNPVGAIVYCTNVSLVHPPPTKYCLSPLSGVQVNQRICPRTFGCTYLCVFRNSHFSRYDVFFEDYLVKTRGKGAIYLQLYHIMCLRPWLFRGKAIFLTPLFLALSPISIMKRESAKWMFLMSWQFQQVQIVVCAPQQLTRNDGTKRVKNVSILFARSALFPSDAPQKVFSKIDFDRIIRLISGKFWKGKQNTYIYTSTRSHGKLYLFR